MNGSSDGLHATGRFLQRHRTLSHSFGEVLALDVIHREIMLPLVFANLVNGHDVRMLQIGRGLRFGVEPLHQRGRSEFSRENHLQRHRAVKGRLPRLEDDAHAASRDLLQQLVISEVADRRILDFGFWILDWGNGTAQANRVFRASEKPASVVIGFDQLLDALAQGGIYATGLGEVFAPLLCVRDFQGFVENRPQR